MSADRTLYEDIVQRRYAFYEKLQRRQAELRLTYDDIAERSGVDADKVGRFIRGDAANPNLFRVEAVCQVLGVSPDVELGNDHHPDADSIHLHRELESARELAAARLDTIDSLRASLGAWRKAAQVAIALAVFFAAAFFIIDHAATTVGFIRDGSLTVAGWIVVAALSGLVAAFSLSVYKNINNYNHGG